MLYLPEDIINEIIQYIPCIIGRSLNNYFKMTTDLNRPPCYNVKYTLNDILEYIDINPQIISLVVPDKQNYIFYKFIRQYNSWSPYDKSKLIEKISNIYSDNIDMGPKFIYFLLNKRENRNKVNYIEKKMIETNMKIVLIIP